MSKIVVHPIVRALIEGTPQAVGERIEAIQHFGGTGDGGNGMEARIAKVEATVSHIQSDLTEVKGDIKGLRNEARNDFRLTFGAIVAVALGLSGLMAKGFGWI